MNIIHIIAQLKGTEINKKDPKVKIGDIVGISNIKNLFAKGYAPILSEEIFVIAKIKNNFPWRYVISDLKGEGIVGTFYKKELQIPNQNQFRVEKVIKKKSNKLYVKCKATIILLTVGLIKKTLYKWVNIFQNRNLQEEEWK